MLAVIATAAVGLPVVAARALAAAAAAREDVTVAQFPALAPLVDGLAVRARGQLGDEAYGKAWAEGRAWSLSQALDRTLEDLTDVDLTDVDVAPGERADV